MAGSSLTTNGFFRLPGLACITPTWVGPRPPQPVRPPRRPCCWPSPQPAPRLARGSTTWAGSPARATPRTWPGAGTGATAPPPRPPAPAPTRPPAAAPTATPPAPGPRPAPPSRSPSPTNLGCATTAVVYPFGRPTASQTARALAAGATLHPQPAAGTLTLTLPGLRAQPPVPARLHDALGRVVRTFALPVPATGPATHRLELAGLPAGLYVLRLRPQEGAISLRVVLE